MAAIATLSMPPALEAMVGAALAVWLPRATVAAVARPDMLAHGGADWVIVAPGADGAAGLPALRRLRTVGYDGPALLLVGDGVVPQADETVELTRLGGRCCALGDGFAERLATEAALRSPGGAGGGEWAGGEGAGGEPGEDAARGRAVTTALHGELAETRRLLALAEVARRLPHALNNPLSALLAEAQLLELEELGPEQREATERIVQLARRVIVLVRELQLAQPRS